MSDEMVLERVKQACAIVQTSLSQGTGYLLRSNRLVTCAHVVSQVPLGGTVNLLFRRKNINGSMLSFNVPGILEKIDTHDDWAIISMEKAIDGIRPLAIGYSPEADARWLSFGYPAKAQGDGLLIEGDVRDPKANIKQGEIPILQLYCEDAAAGQGPYLQGFSGSPVLIAGRVVGHLRNILPDKTGRAEYGAIFACPAERYLQALPPEQEPVWNAQAAEVGYDALWYVHRKTVEKTALNYLTAPGSPVVLVAPEHYGKTALLEHIFDRIRRRDTIAGRSSRIVKIDFIHISEQERSSFDSLVSLMIANFSEQLNLPKNTAEPKKRPKSIVPIGPQLKLRDFIRGATLISPQPLFLAIEGADAIYNCNYAADFYACLRSIAVERSEPFPKLRFLLTLSTNPALLDGPEFSLFFGLCPPLLLEDLDKEQTASLASLYNITSNDPGLELLHELVGGHPGLMRWALYQACTKELPLKQLVLQAKVDFQDGIFAYPLHRLYSFLLKNRLIAALCGVMRNPKYELSAQEYNTLYRKGIVRMTSAGHYKIRNPLFAYYFHTLCDK